jgi:putative ABC transport system permease protein
VLLAALKLLGILLALGLVVLVIYLLIALLRMLAIGVVQWRDLISIDRWQEVFITIGRNKLRTALTTISVAWGIFVLVFLLGLGQGLDNGLRKTFQRDAKNTVWIIANKTSIPHGGYDIGRRLMFENADYERAKRVEGVESIAGGHWVAGRGWGSQPIRRGHKVNAFQINAHHPDVFKLTSHSIVQGRFLSASDESERRKSVVLGRTAAQFLFEGEDPIGGWILVNNVPFQVVGVFTDPAGNEQERQIYIPVSTAQLAFNGGDKLGELGMTVGNASAERSKEIIDDVVGQLADKHNFDPADKQAVRVWNNIEGSERFRKMFFMISAFILVIGLGTLAAGVVGVSNIMMISVKERTKEIGVRKALGATPRSIIFMVIQEAVFLTAFAGLLGLAGGVGVLGLIGKYFSGEFMHDPSIDLTIGIAAAVFLVVAGALAGYFPARAAARVNPVHTLRDQ